VCLFPSVGMVAPGMSCDKCPLSCIVLLIASRTINERSGLELVGRDL